MMTLEERLNSTDKSIEAAREMLYEMVAYSVDHNREAKQWRAEYEARQAEYEARAEADRAELAQLKAETERARAEGEQARKALNKKLGELSHKLGTMVEDFVLPDLPRQLRLIAGLPDDEPIGTSIHIERPNPNRNGGRQMVEIDAIAQSDSHVLFNETKSTLRSGDVTGFAGVMSQIRLYFPEYEGRTIIGVMSSFQVSEEMVRYASRQGLIVLAIDEGLLTVQNVPDFQWKAF